MRLPARSLLIPLTLAMACSGGGHAVPDASDDASNDAELPATAALVVSAPTGTLRERGAAVTFTVTLAVAPTSDVVVALSSTDSSEATVSPTSLTFTGTDWSSPHVVTVASVDDWRGDGAQPVSIAFTSPTSADARYAALPAQTALTLSNGDDDSGGGYHVRTSFEEGGVHYMAHSYYHGMISPLTDTMHNQQPGDFEWRIVPGLADPNDPSLVSFISPSFPGRYLRIDSANPAKYPSGAEGANHEDGLYLTPVAERNYLAWLDTFTDTQVFRSDATFRVVSARNGNPAMVSFQWHGDATRYLRHQNYQMYARVPDGSAQQSAETSFTLEPLGFLVARRADPHITHHTDGYYYLTASVPEYDRIEIRRATTLRGLADAVPTTVWTKHPTGVMAAHIWAPELHFIGGKWYVYFAAGGAAPNMWAIRMYVLESAAANPLDGPWVERGQVNSPWDTFSLDATTFELAGTRYLLWAQDDPSINTDGTSLFIAAMSDPWTITGTPVRIARPEFTWETMGFAVNEGPAVLVRNGRVFVSYSASATDARYCLGLLSASDTSNLLAAASWAKGANPVFVSANGLYGPGHNSFTTSADRSVDVLVYHARNYQAILGDPLFDGNRHTRIQRLGWNPDGTPQFGQPILDGMSTLGE